LSHGFFIFRFTTVEDRDRVLLQGPCVLNDAVLAMGPWTLEFHPAVASLPKCIVWLRLPDLPSTLWTPSALSLIVSKAGSLIRLDECTELLVKGRYTRVAVEID